MNGLSTFTAPMLHMLLLSSAPDPVSEGADLPATRPMNGEEGKEKGCPLLACPQQGRDASNLLRGTDERCWQAEFGVCRCLSYC